MLQLDHFFGQSMQVQGYTLGNVIHATGETIVSTATSAAGDPVVLKILDSDLPAPEMVARWQHEFSVLQKLDSEWIIKAKALERQGRRWILVLEPFGSINLAQVIAQNLLDVGDRLQLAIQLTQAIGAVHAHGYIQGDVAPKNVLVDFVSLQVKLCDFGLATELEHEQRREPHHAPRGTLEYMSPEQTGRTNLEVDYRSDFYSLGISLYELFLGQTPFLTHDAMSLLHAQLALNPVPLHEADSSIPRALSNLVQKLLAKYPEERYQSSFGLLQDLQFIAENLHSTSKLEQFQIANADVPERFCLPQKLYGRESEISQILAAYERIAEGSKQLVLISGEAGAGKTALVGELHRPIVVRRGYFLRGKCEQYGRDQPYLAMVRAFEPLLQQLMLEGETRRHYWRTKLATALGANAGVIAAILPSLSLLLGALPALPLLPPAEREQRFHLAFLQFAQSLAAANHPVMLFLDDLQWADASTLRLLNQLLSDEEAGHLLIVGAYRWQEVNDDHPLTSMLEKLRALDIRITDLKLKALNLDNVLDLLADTVRQSKPKLRPLAQQLLDKTNGNPFFLQQFLHELHAHKALTYDRAVGAWHWESAQVAARSMTENVVMLMLGKLRALPAKTQRALAHCALLGEQFELSEVMAVLDESAQRSLAALWPVLELGLLVPLNDGYLFEQSLTLLESASFGFLHDRVQQAAFSLTAPEELSELRLNCGRSLLAKLGADALNKRLYTILGCWNEAKALVLVPEERQQLLALNLRGGIRAKESSALDSAVNFLRHAKSLLAEDVWRTDPDQALSVYKELSEAEYLAGNFAEAELLYPEAMASAPSVAAKVTMLLIQTDQRHIQGLFPAALPILRAALTLLGKPFPEDEPAAGALFAPEFNQVEALLAARSPAQLLNMPEMRDPDRLLEMRVYFALSYATYQSGQFAAFAVNACRMMDASLAHGQGDLTGIAYVCYMTAMAAMKRPYPLCYQMGKIALTQAESRENPYFRMPVYQYFAPFYQHWCDPLQDTVEKMDVGLELALTGINPLSGGYCAVLSAINRASFGLPLQMLEAETQPGLKFLRRSRQPKSEAMLRCGVIQPMLALQGKTLAQHSFDSLDFTIDSVFAGDYQSPSIPLAFYYAARLRHAVLFNLSSPAPELRSMWSEAAAQVGVIGQVLPDSPSWVDALFFQALGCLDSKLCPGLPDQAFARETALRFALFAADCESNFLSKQLILQAELARVEGQEKLAMEFYARAIDAAASSEFLVLEALANELYARFWSGQQQRQLGRNFIREAYHLYRRWGASAKCAELEKAWPDVSLRSHRQRFSVSESAGTLRNSSDHGAAFDLQSLLKANQLLAKELQLDTLLPQMLSVLMENAGAEHGAIVLEEETGLILEVTGGLGAARSLQAVRLGQRLSSSDEETALPRSAGDAHGAQHEDSVCTAPLPLALIEYTRLTRTILVLNNPARDARFARSVYLQERQPKSVLCLPVLNQGKMIALVYLENNQFENAFTTKQQQLLELLSTQAAISLVNARLVENLEAKVELRTQELRQMSMKDGLTGIANRRAFDERLDNEWRKRARNGSSLSLLMIDIDHFKLYNDSLGHLEGDRCIRMVANTLESAVARTQGVMVARYGGEEFSVLLPECELSQAFAAAEALQAGLRAQRIVHPNSTVGEFVSLSIGVATINELDFEQLGHERLPANLLAAADAALYRAKHLGRDRICVSSRSESA